MFFNFVWMLSKSSTSVLTNEEKRATDVHKPFLINSTADNFGLLNNGEPDQNA